MRRGFFPWGCLLAVLVLVVLAAAGGAWWYFGAQRNLTSSPPGSSVQVFLLQPSSGDEVHAGDYVGVSLNAFAPTPIKSSELFVDGQSIGAISEAPESASWTWQAWPAGVHTLAAKATASSGETGNSQTVIVNVVALNDTMSVAAVDGQTLAQLGEKFGVPPDQMNEANPHLDPNTPLKDGQPVDVPVGGSGGGAPPQPPGGGGPGGGASPPHIVWDLQLKGPADKSYCYVSSGDGVWDKMPKDPFDFFGQLENLYTQVLDVLPAQDSVVQAQCWAWVGGALKFLGQGQGKFDGTQVPIVADGFQLIGVPQPAGGGGPQAKIVGPTVPPPYALREPDNVEECSAHGPNPVPDLCKVLMNAPVKQYVLLIWEWQPGLSWPGQFASINDITGFRVYEINSSSSTQKLIDTVPLGSTAKFAAPPLPWGQGCYGVEAYAEEPGYGTLTSKMATYCTGTVPATQVIDETPTNWITTADEWISIDCPGQTGQYTQLNKQTGFGNQPEILVGGNMTDDGDCFSQTTHSGAVLFSTPVLPPGAVIQEALLKFTKVYDYFYVSGTAGPAYGSCVSGLGSAKKDWTGLDAGNHYAHDVTVDGFGYFSPFTSQVVFGSAGTDVTPIVSHWIQHPSENQGFIFSAAPAPTPPNGGEGRCFNGLGNFHLEIHYFAP